MISPFTLTAFSPVQVTRDLIRQLLAFVMLEYSFPPRWAKSLLAPKAVGFVLQCLDLEKR